MKRLFASLIVFACGVCSGADAPAFWPAATQSGKPWTRWWWPASAVDRAGLTRELETLAAAGIGGVEITPIYGARGFEDRSIDFLSPRWVEMLEHTTREAQRLGLGVDMATGTGWPFGGPEVSAAQGSSSMILENGRLAGKPTGMKVKRAAPGGAGLVLDPYAPDALDAYLERFTRALAAIPRGAVRSQFHDSFEYYQASWTPLLAAEFTQLNGYDIQAHAAALMGQPLDVEIRGRVAGDYRRTLAKLHLDYVNHWVAWSHARGSLARNQAHGAPGNLLDLYAAADIPETESFGMTQLNIAGLRSEPAWSKADPDPPLSLVGRFASSAGHVMNRPLISSETLTWLRENFRETPAAAKPQLDRLFVAGINHIFYHGTTYSPPDVPWPGWYFYAASQLGGDNPLREHFTAMNAYVARVQSVLQAGRADNDILLYWPFDELSDQVSGLMNQYGVHEIGWLMETPFADVAQRLLAGGYSFDFVSDAQLERLTVEKGALLAPGGRYRVVVVPAVKRMPPATLAKLRDLQRQGAALILEALPGDVPGFARLEARRAELAALLAEPALRAAVAPGGLNARLEELAVRREGAGAAGLGYIRRARDDGFDYFLTNLTPRAYEGWLQLGVPATQVLLLDPLSADAGIAGVRHGRAGVETYLQLASGQSLILRTSDSRPQTRDVPRWRYLAPASDGIPITGEWQVEFIKGGPALPAAARMRELQGWTALDADAERFAGTARYRIEFDAPAPRADAWWLDLGDVREAASVRVNGQALGKAWCPPFRLLLRNALKSKGNVLEIEVSNLPANRIRDLDARKVDWKIMKDANLVTLAYTRFDASGWDVAPSGLLGPVRLVPLEVVRPR